VYALSLSFDVEPEACKLQIRYLINYVRIEVRDIRTMKLMHDIYIGYLYFIPWLWNNNSIVESILRRTLVWFFPGFFLPTVHPTVDG
jgi:hypothetical protein